MIIPFTNREIPSWIMREFMKDAAYVMFFYGMIFFLAWIASVVS